MEATTVTLDRGEARRLYRDYKAHVHYSTPIDDEVRRTYQLLAQGRIVIRALDSITAAGLGEDGLPKLAIVRADSPTCTLRAYRGAAEFRAASVTSWSARSNEHWSRRITVPWPGFTTARYEYEAITPLVPVHLRPKRGLQNYFVLFEAIWGKRIPVDPMLIRRIGRSDLWLVVAVWDLTVVEQAALAGRLNG